MLHNIINELGHRLDVRDKISEKYFFHVFSYHSLVSGALILGINALLIIKPMELCYRCYTFFCQCFLICIIIQHR